MQTALTPTQRLAEEVLGTDLGEYVQSKRRARPRWSWALIAEQLEIDTQGKVSVTPQALWDWYASSEKRAS
jgi:hypothetical protein